MKKFSDVFRSIQQTIVELREQANKWWVAIDGTPTQTTVTEAPVTREFVMPGGRGYPFSQHAMTLIHRTTTIRWPRFWKQPVVVSGYDIIIDDPPAIPAQGLAKAMGRKTGGLYGLFVKDAASAEEAMNEYHLSVLRARTLTA